MPDYKLPLCRPTWGPVERAAINAVLDTGRVTMGEQTALLEAEFAELVGAKHALFVTSGSAALLLAAFWLKDHPLGPSRFVVGTPAVTWPTTIWPFMQAGLMVSLVDIDPETLVVKEWPDRPFFEAVVPVHLMGNICPHRDDTTNIIEDSCEELSGRTFKGRIGCYSGYFSHHISTGEGGFVVTNDMATNDWLRSARAHGWARHSSLEFQAAARSKAPEIDPRFLFPQWGFNCKPTDLLAAVGREQLKKLGPMNTRRVMVFRHWSEALKAGGWAAPMKPTRPDIVPFAFPIICPDGSTRKRAVEAFEATGVETRPIAAGNLLYQPAMLRPDIARMLHMPQFLPGADRVHKCAFFIGLDGALTDDDVAWTGDLLRNGPWAQ